MKRIIKWLSLRRVFYKLALKVIANNLVHSENRLTPDYLKSKGWNLVDGFWIEPDVKERDKIWIKFESHYFRVWHGKEKTFISLEKTVEWFENYYLLVHPENGRYKLSVN